jgi:hypothetical protein
MNANATKHFCAHPSPDSARWQLLHENFRLDVPNCAELAHKTLPHKPGLYAWTLRTEMSELALYIGRAASLRRRIYNYTQAFQPHAPNDRKLFFAQMALIRKFPEAEFPLYWRRTEKEALTTAETEAINLHSPILNQRGVYSVEHKARLEKAYASLYEEIVDKYLQSSREGGQQPS